MVGHFIESGYWSQAGIKSQPKSPLQRGGFPDKVGEDGVCLAP